MVIRSSYYMFRRLFRNYIGMSILLLLPIALITVLGLIADNAVDDTLGIPMKDQVAVSMMLSFLLFGGFFTMEYVKEDLLSSMKWRMYSLPYPSHKHAYSILISCTLFNVLQSFLIVLYTLFVYDVNWGNLVFVFIILLTVATVVQFVFINFVLGVNHYKTAERLGTGFGLACLMVSEMWFPLPEGPFFQFLSMYSNPFALGQNMILATITGENIDKAIISFIILLVSAIVLAISGAYFGRRKLS
ncbi:ABC transporter permease [Alkalihalobacillus sp. MEB130]|uniref:ABC transporter permease n=1 Tax=Alkalihalobacillus sp. MEB130 TaxID=2976704 RepID=UPI0028DE3E33|nr:ABC transporter permease [Alkalihalobacillus sp. MEB130]MDT8861848.1 ABC transporter permease [Alkalihalobacillus sp. MEB130]